MKPSECPTCHLLSVPAEMRQTAAQRAAGPPEGPPGVPAPHPEAVSAGSSFPGPMDL